jgi:GTPase SAR1 family protein
MYHGAAGIIVVFDVTNKTSMTNVHNWIEAFWNVDRSLSRSDIPVVIFGNKIDLRDSVPDAIPTETAKEYVDILSKKYQMNIDYIETSALTGENIKYAFNYFVDKIAEIQEKQ